jgi:prepilin signal peptidase PulO-like enzyme (type II secretory pathway)
METSLFLLFVAVFGVVIGSFLNAVIWRLRVGRSFVSGRSVCTHCGHELAAKDLIPLFSYAWLRGRCRYCAKGIGWQYPAVEAAVSAAFVIVAWQLMPADFLWTSRLLAKLLLSWYAVAMLALVFVYDLRYMLILSKVTLPAAAILFVGNLLLDVPLFSLLIGLVVGYGFFWLQYAFSKGKWIGGGDLQLGLLIGALLGWQKTLVAFWFAYVLGAVFAVGLLAVKKRHWQSQLPFGTFLAVGAFIAMLWGDAIIRRYFAL